MEIERIKFERTGGFAGIRIAADFELDDLPEEQSRALAELLEDVKFRSLPERLTGKTPMPDQFTYTITVESGKGKHTVTLGDSSADEKMQELLQLLNRIARSRMKKQ